MQSYNVGRTKIIQSLLNIYFDGRNGMFGKYHFQRYFPFSPSPIIKGVIAILMSPNIFFCRLAHVHFRVNEAKFYHVQSNQDRSILIIFKSKEII